MIKYTYIFLFRIYLSEKEVIKKFIEKELKKNSNININIHYFNLLFGSYEKFNLLLYIEVTHNLGVSSNKTSFLSEDAINFIKELLPVNRLFPQYQIKKIIKDEYANIRGSFEDVIKYLNKDSIVFKKKKKSMFDFDDDTEQDLSNLNEEEPPFSLAGLTNYDKVSIKTNKTIKDSKITGKGKNPIKNLIEKIKKDIPKIKGWSTMDVEKIIEKLDNLEKLIGESTKSVSEKIDFISKYIEENVSDQSIEKANIKKQLDIFTQNNENLVKIFSSYLESINIDVKETKDNSIALKKILSNLTNNNKPEINKNEYFKKVITEIELILVSDDIDEMLKNEYFEQIFNKTILRNNIKNIKIGLDLIANKLKGNRKEDAECLKVVNFLFFSEKKYNIDIINVLSKEWESLVKIVFSHDSTDKKIINLNKK